MRKLVLLATYWDEIEWIGASLDQLCALKPDQIIICDGCFDDREENYSTDGTTEVIQKFAKENKNVTVVNALRVSRITYVFKTILLNKRSLTHWFRTIVDACKTSPYRLNQALTFNSMLAVARKNGIDFSDWFMTIDADQFYSDEIVEKISARKNFEESCALLTADELTFLDDQKNFSDNHEVRTWNNMPHRIMEAACFYPTRHYKVLHKGRLKFLIDVYPHKHLGHYFHYKFRENLVRFQKGYSLGDRKQINLDQNYSKQPFSGDHPAVIKKWKKF